MQTADNTVPTKNFPYRKDAVEEVFDLYLDLLKQSQL